MDFTTYRPWQCNERRSLRDVADQGQLGGLECELVRRTYRDLEHELLAIVVGLKSVQDSRQLGSVELDYSKVSN